MATANATLEKMTLDRSDGSSTMELYRAALGPLHTDYYLKAFTRFDALGKTEPQWNWTAALLTLGWLLFRQMWATAVVYAGALVTAALLILGIAGVVFQAADSVQWVLTGLVLLLAVGLPGALGNSWLYTVCNKKMERALVDSATLEEACAWLSARAPGRRRLGVVLASQLALLASLTSVVLAWHNSASLPGDTNQSTPVLPVESLRSGLIGQTVATVAAVPTAATASAPTVAPAVSPAPASEASALAAATPDAGAPKAVAASRISQGIVQSAAPPATPVVKPQAAPAPSVAPASSPAPAPVAKPVAASASTPVAKTAPPTEAKTTTNGPYQINIGLFADANNARNARARLQDAGLPVLSQVITSAKGQRTRVRVGPFETLAEADRAAEKIRALKLEAVVVQP